MKIGFIGLGAMGAPMARNLISKGFEVAVHNRTRDKEIPLESEGAMRAGSPAEAAAEADIVITIVSDTSDVEEVLFGKGGVAEEAGAGSVVADMSTIDPDAAREFATRFADKMVGFVDAPVSGGTEGAQAGTLSIMAGGEKHNLDKVMPALEAMGKTINHVGPVGAGQTTKAINQIIIAGTFMAVAEGMAVGSAAGIDMERALNALQAGAADSWVLRSRSGRMLDRTYPLGFKLELHRKDLRIALSLAESIGLDLRCTRLVSELEDRLIDLGRGAEDMSALYESLFL